MEAIRVNYYIGGIRRKQKFSELGKVMRITKTGNLLVRSKFIPRSGQNVFLGSKKEAGRVSRVFGPKIRPFVCVRPLIPITLSLMGKELYVNVRGSE